MHLAYSLKRQEFFGEAKAALLEALRLGANLRGLENEIYYVSKAMVARSSPEKQKSFQLGGVYLGTTGQCNASCSHCPTGKEVTRNSPRFPMPLELSDRIFREIAFDGYSVSRGISFGLFGDGLLDPFVVERARRAREILPTVSLSVNTNAAAYNRKRHAPLRDLVSVIVVHTESLHPDTYHHLMTPLRLERVLPKIHQIIEDFGQKCAISIPISRLNAHEFPAMRSYFLERGAGEVRGDILINRCQEDSTAFNDIAISPQKHWCAIDALEHLVIDTDGQMLICCCDFERKEPLGNLNDMSLRDILDSERRRFVTEIFEKKHYHELKTCSSCWISGSVHPEHTSDHERQPVGIT